MLELPFFFPLRAPLHLGSLLLRVGDLRSARLDFVCGGATRAVSSSHASVFFGRAVALDVVQVCKLEETGDNNMTLQTEYQNSKAQALTPRSNPSGKVFSSLDEQWHRAYGCLRAFAQREGHVRVPLNHIEDGVRLNMWISTQIKRHHRRMLIGSRIILLEGLPGWTWDRNSGIWDQHYEALLAFTEREGHAQIPKKHVENGFHLGTWVSHQRARRKNGQMGQDRQERLSQVRGWSWEVGHHKQIRHHTAWDRHYAALLLFVAREGHARVPTAHLEGNCRLGPWVRDQRRVYQEGLLLAERIQRLKKVAGWTWNIPYLERGKNRGNWEQCYSQLAAFAERFGHTRVPPNYRVNGGRLDSWVTIQRMRYRNNRLNQERMQRLESIPGWVWEVRIEKESERWERHYRALEHFVQLEGHALVPRGHIENGLRLGIWVISMRMSHRRGTLPLKYAKRFESLRGWSWDPIADNWENWLMLLEDYVAEHNTAFIRNEAIYAGRRLGGWACEQRQSFKAGKLSIDRSNRLANLPGWSWNPIDDAWESWFELLNNYVAVQKTALVPNKTVDGGRLLGDWVSKQRTAFRKGKLQDDRRRRLEALPDWYWDRAEQRSWNEAYDHLLEFARREGHARVPLTHEESGYLLGPWVEEQRVLHARGELIGRRSQKLEGLPLWSWSFS